MKAAALAVQRPADARLLVVDAEGGIEHRARSELAEVLVRGDLVVANDAATLPASLSGHHLASGADVEVRLAGRGSLVGAEAGRFLAVVFGAGDFRTRTEDRSAPPRLARGDTLVLGPLTAAVSRIIRAPRLIELSFAGTAEEIRAGIARHGRPVQYAHLPEPLALWDVWTAIAAQPVAFEAPSAGFVLDWRLLDRFAARGIGFATLTHAAGLSSTGDAGLDACLPFDEAYHLPEDTVAAVRATKRRGDRVIALGTTVTRALEHAAARPGGLPAGPGIATQRIGAATRLRVVDALMSGTHEPGSSHHALLRAFVSAATLARMDEALEAGGYRSHEFGDSVLVSAARPAPRRART
jgi:S-adenosylmethionine:tRNA ribosyltransferase-isomerase